MAGPSSMRAMRGPAKGERKPRNHGDFYRTPPEAIRALLNVQADGHRLQRLGMVWEPACGDGAMAVEIRNAGLACVATDLHNRGCPDSSTLDFFSASWSPPALITNPPYNLVNGQGRAKWLKHSLELRGWSYMALLLNAEWDRAQKVREVLAAHPYSWRWDLGWRIDWDGRGRPSSWHSWFVWDRRSMDRMRVRFMPLAWAGGPISVSEAAAP